MSGWSISSRPTTTELDASPRLAGSPIPDSARYNELLNSEIFFSLKEAQVIIKQWQKHDKIVKPRSALNYRPPAPQTFATPAQHLGEIMPMQ